MSKHYQNIDAGYFDYELISLEGIPHRHFRGPAIDPTAPFIACVGAAQTFGRFADRPFSHVVGESLKLPVLNLGVGGAGPRFFLDDKFLSLVNRARLVIVQVLSGRSESNSLFDNRSSGTLWGTRLRDQETMRFDQFLADLLRSEDPAVIHRILNETRQNYVTNMVQLLSSIRRPKILLWLSTRGPAYQESFSSAWAAMGGFPHLVDKAVIDKLTPHVNAYVEVVSRAGLPQKLWPADSAIEGADLEGNVLVNRYYPSPEMHADAGEQLASECAALMQQAETAPDWPIVHAITPRPIPFIILGAERTGSNLLWEMLRRHPDCFLLGELFNWKIIDSRVAEGLPASEQERLHRLRTTDPVNFLGEVLAGVGTRCTAAGFKLMYGHARRFPMVVDAILEDQNIRIIHIRRRNLLRRYISQERALKSGQWICRNERDVAVVPPISVSLPEVAKDVERTRDEEMSFAARIAQHQVLNLWYEDLSESPTEFGRRAADFVGLRSDVPLKVGTVRTGDAPLSHLISNYAALKLQSKELSSFFESE